MIERHVITKGNGVTLKDKIFDDTRIVGKYRVINFKGTEQDFDKLLDRLYSNTNPIKVIGIYEGLQK